MPGNIYTINSSTPETSEPEAWVYERLAAALRIRQSPCFCDNLLRRSMLKRVLAAIAPPATRTVRAASGIWNALAPGITMKLLRVDDEQNMTAFVRMEPGSIFGAHRHTQGEECLVLEGEIIIGAHRLHAGDMHVAAAGTDHAMVTSPHGALILLRGQLC